MHTILICDDEPDIVSALKIYLEAEGYAAVCTCSGQEALDALDRDREIRLVLLDIMMPGLDGLAALQKIRSRSNVPVIFLTAKSEDTDKILGLNLGADDYVTKPFNPVELLARVRSQLRRYLQLGGGMQREGTLCVGGIRLDDERKEVTLDGEPVSLTPTEYEILRLLMREPGKVFRPDAIYRAVWHEEPYGGESTVAVHIRHLREKLEIDPGEPRCIKAVWGQGYKIE
ncbi:MAG: response regulator transcription factor [Oscillospiraceae bacterium]|nr:response regulator transcription factor [Oscillospiraceae bacterium]